MNDKSIRQSEKDLQNNLVQQQQQQKQNLANMSSTMFSLRNDSIPGGEQPNFASFQPSITSSSYSHEGVHKSWDTNSNTSLGMLLDDSSSTNNYNATVGNVNLNPTTTTCNNSSNNTNNSNNMFGGLESESFHYASKTPSTSAGSYTQSVFDDQPHATISSANLHQHRQLQQLQQLLQPFPSTLISSLPATTAQPSISSSENSSNNAQTLSNLFQPLATTTSHQYPHQQTLQESYSTSQQNQANIAQLQQQIQLALQQLSSQSNQNPLDVLSSTTNAQSIPFSSQQQQQQQQQQQTYSHPPPPSSHPPSIWTSATDNHSFNFSADKASTFTTATSSSPSSTTNQLASMSMYPSSLSPLSSTSSQGLNSTKAMKRLSSSSSQFSTESSDVPHSDEELKAITRNKSRKYRLKKKEELSNIMRRVQHLHQISNRKINELTVYVMQKMQNIGNNSSQSTKKLQQDVHIFIMKHYKELGSPFQPPFQMRVISTKTVKNPDGSTPSTHKEKLRLASKAYRVEKAKELEVWEQKLQWYSNIVKNIDFFIKRMQDILRREQ